MTRRVAHVITALRTGGAERMLVRLLSCSEALRRECAVVVTLVPGGELEAPLAALGVPVRSVGLARGQVSPGALRRLGALLDEAGAGLVHAWMYHACVAAALGGGGRPLVWNVRHALHAHRRERPLTALLIRAAALLSRRPRRIVYNSATSRRQHAAIGYHDARALVIPNGFVIPPEPELPGRRAALRAELGVDDAAPLVGVVARFDPLKDFPTLFAAFRRVAEARPDARLVVAGEGASWEEPAFARLADEAGVRARVLPLGRRAEGDRLFPAFDVAVSASLSESFPNAVGEAMASAVPPVATDVGDCAALVGDAGRLVPPRDPAALAAAVLELLALPSAARAALGARARAHVSSTFSIAAIARRYEALHGEVAGA